MRRSCKSFTTLPSTNYTSLHYTDVLSERRTHYLCIKKTLHIRKKTRLF